MQGSEGRGPETVPSLPGSSEASRQREGASLEPWHVQVTLMKRSEDRGHSRLRTLRRDRPSPALCAALNLPARISGLRPRVRGATKEVQKLCAHHGPGGATRTLLDWGQGPACVSPQGSAGHMGTGRSPPPPTRSLQRQVSDGFPEVGVAGRLVASVLQPACLRRSHDHVVSGAWKDTDVGEWPGPRSLPEAPPSQAWGRLRVSCTWPGWPCRTVASPRRRRARTPQGCPPRRTEERRTHLAAAGGSRGWGWR